ncbi:small RNA-binding protein 11, chloroplastic isoform X2 [Actinidia eriantha]|uniref:small RNA-binding protein 11, chloroplastic isoform X2 n=1 Tax=Actinidia eriantha TaxID=165200 RepID=UPI00258F4451|nr:small RNA-binding protein 11, chloroplastic isoform X2 [Actinidia eriantha]
MNTIVRFNSFSNPQQFLQNHNRTRPKSVHLRASLSNFPLASKIMVRNLSYSTNENFLRKEFSNFGQIAEVKVVTDVSTKKSKGYAFIQYTDHDDAMQALESMDHQVLNGRMIFVDLAKPGRKAFGGYPRTSGPPQKQNLVKQDETIE